MARRTTLLALQVTTFLFTAAIACAQTATGVIEGTVRDDSGAFIAGATIRLVNEATNQAREQVSNEEGIFEFRALPRGDYTLEAERAGFKKQVITNIGLQVAQTQTELDRLKVPASVDGEALQVNVRPGEFVGAPPGQALVVLGDLTKLHVRVDLRAGTLTPGAPVGMLQHVDEWIDRERTDRGYMQTKSSLWLLLKIAYYMLVPRSRGRPF